MRTRSWLIVGLALAITVATTVIHGRVRHRWGFADNTQQLGEALLTLPDRIGGWELKREKRLDPSVVQLLECVEHVNNVYYHAKLDATVEVAVMLGAAGPMSVHTPDVCYRNTDFQIQGSMPLPLGDDRFELVSMQSKGVDQMDLQVAYGWWDGKRWDVPRRPRLTYAFQPHLYKLQLAIPNPTALKATGEGGQKGQSESPDTTLVTQFLNDFLPVLNEVALRPKAPSGVAQATN